MAENWDQPATGGYLRLGSIRRIPVRIHWTAPLMAVLFGRLEFVPAFWLAFLGLILIHELGHAAIVRLVRARVVGVDLDGAGGLCHWKGRVSDVQLALIAWGGIFGQAIAGVVTVAALAVFGAPTDEYLAQVVRVFTRVNLFMAAYNLIPIRHLDGAKAWKLFPLLLERARRRMQPTKAAVARREAKKHLARLDDLEVRARADAPDVEELLSRITSEVNKSSDRASKK